MRRALALAILSILTVAMAVLPAAAPQQLPGTGYGSFSAAFAAPALTGVGTATLTYSAGNLYQGGLVKAITAGTFTSLGASATTCAAPAFSSCEIVYWASGTGLTHSTAYVTAYGNGANVIVGYLTTDGSSLILTITPATLNIPLSVTPVGYSCGASLAAAGACANTPLLGTFHIVTGSAVLGSNTSTITGFAPAFTSSTSWWCVANDITTRANPVQMIPASTTTAVITNTTGATDLIQFVCMGN